MRKFTLMYERLTRLGLCLAMLAANASLTLAAPHESNTLGNLDLSIASGVVGTGTPASCTEAELDAALAGGGIVTFNCGAAPHTIILTDYKSIAENTEIQGGDLITLSGGDTTSLFQVLTDKTLSLRDITLRQGDGAVTSGFGAIQNFGTLNLINSQLISNTSPASGGAIDNRGGLNLTNSIVAENTASQSGGGIYNEGGAVTIQGSDIYSNTAANGGGIYNVSNSSITLNDSTLRGNPASDVGGGGVYNLGTATLTHVTFSGNIAGISGGGIYRDSGTVSVKNTIVGNSPSGGNCAGTVTNNGFNLSSDASCGGFNQVANVMLGPLADNGGPTQTHLPQPGSPAIDFVATNCPPPATDQRGVSRPVDGDGIGGAACDAGAVEYGAVISAVYLPLVIK